VLRSELLGRRQRRFAFEQHCRWEQFAESLHRVVGDWLDVSQWRRRDGEARGLRVEYSTLPSPRHFAAALPAPSFAAIDAATVFAPRVIASPTSCEYLRVV
jgi:hypothetical protein